MLCSSTRSTAQTCKLISLCISVMSRQKRALHQCQSLKENTPPKFSRCLPGIRRLPRSTNLSGISRNSLAEGTPQADKVAMKSDVKEKGTFLRQLTTNEKLWELLHLRMCCVGQRKLVVSCAFLSVQTHGASKLGWQKCSARWHTSWITH